MRRPVKHIGPGGAEIRPVVVRSEQVFQCAGDHDADSVQTGHYHVGNVDLPGLIGDKTGRTTVDQNLSHTPVPVLLLDHVPTGRVGDDEILRICNVGRI